MARKFEFGAEHKISVGLQGQVVRPSAKAFGQLFANFGVDSEAEHPELSEVLEQLRNIESRLAEKLQEANAEYSNVNKTEKVLKSMSPDAIREMLARIGHTGVVTEKINH